ncbi:MAG: radical SAM protein [Planctomycetes bacterium]|nr:radical SAM protein [Planctomycetota bacterium]
MCRTLLVNEIYSSIQGEGSRAGRPCVMVRLSGCDVRCRWCDTAYAYEHGQAMGLDEIVQRIRQLDAGLVELTGGEPLCQPAATELLSLLCDAGWEVLLETSGTKDISTVDPRVVRIVDIKCPGSGAVEKVCWANIDLLRSGDEVKFVLTDRCDYEFAREVISRCDLSARCTVLMGTVASGQLTAGELANWMLADRLPVRLNVQLHKILWPGKDRGV